jgi:hypothetical protein
MGNSFASKRIKKKIQRMLSGCEERHIFKGLLVEFDTVGPVPRERLVKGMLVDTPDGERLVNFCPSVESTSVVPLSSLDVGDIVVVLGTKHEHIENATSPHLIALPEEHTLLVPEEPPRFPGDFSNKNTAAFDGTITIVCIFLYCISLFTFPRLLPLIELFIVVFGSFAVPSIVAILYQKYSLRARVLQFAPESWIDVVAFIKDHITVYRANIFDQ